MKMRMLLALAVAALATSGSHAQSVDATAAMDLAKKSGCLACHALDTRMVGPAWKDVGKKYAGDPEAEAKLVAKVRKGGKGAWGEVPMPPNVTVKETDVRTLVQFVLALK